MAAGRPVLFIGDPNGEVARILREAQCGVSVFQGDVPGLTVALEKLAGSARLREEWGANARVALERRFDKSHAMRAWSDVIDRLI
jgi:glycosyltransferase involved in cell wall biosynthesis